MSQIFKYIVLSPQNSKSYGLSKVQLINWELVFMLPLSEDKMLEPYACHGSNAYLAHAP